MCGLFGFVSRDIPKLKLIDLVKQSLIMNSLRGVDGSGIALVDDKGAVHVYKRPFPGPDLVQLVTTNSLLSKCDSPVFGLVHTRSSTSGSNTTESTHPVSYKHITLIHNGSVHSLQTLGADYGTHDSTAIAQALADKQEKEALELIQGSYALIWYNQLDQTFNVARNDQRPLYLATIKKSKSVLYGSEDGMLLWLADRNDIEIKDISSVPTGIHTKTSINADVKSRAFKFTATPAAAVVTYFPATDWGYSITAEDERFIASYQGILEMSAQRKSFKFKKDSDPMYAWLTPFDALVEPLLIKDRKYNLQAEEPRTVKSNSGNLEAALISTVPIEIKIIRTPPELAAFYKAGQDIEFTINSIFYGQGHRPRVSFVGMAEDSSMVEVRGFDIPDLKLNTTSIYTGVIKSAITSKKGDYILVDPTSLKLKDVNALSSGVECGWCTAPLTSSELVDNRVYGLSNDGSLCNSCIKQYNRGMN